MNTLLLTFNERLITSFVYPPRMCVTREIKNCDAVDLKKRFTIIHHRNHLSFINITFIKVNPRSQA